MEKGWIAAGREKEASPSDELTRCPRSLKKHLGTLKERKPRLQSQNMAGLFDGFQKNVIIILKLHVTYNRGKHG